MFPVKKDIAPQFQHTNEEEEQRVTPNSDK